MMALVVGVIIFAVFALGLESIPKYFLIGNGSSLAQYVTTHLWSYALVGAGLAGIFEETGRWIAFRFILKKHTDKKTAITYGIGHGGIEAVILLSVGAFQYITYAVMINQGVFGTIVEQVRMVSPDQVEAVEAVAVALTSLTFGNSLIGCVERLFAVIFHISASVLVFKSVREKKWYYFVLAVVLHGLVDVFAAMYQFGVITSIWVVEGLIGAWAVGIGIFAYKVYKGLKAE